MHDRIFRMVENKHRQNFELNKKGIEFKKVSHGPVKTIDDAARELNVPTSLLVKVLLITYGSQDKYGVLALRGSDSIDWRKVAKTFRVPRRQVDLAREEDIPKLTGSTLGALQPFGYDDRFTVLFDRELARGKVVFCSAGSNSESLLIRPQDLVNIARARVVDLTRKKRVR